MDTIDTRSLQSRLEDLENEGEELRCAVEEAEENLADAIDDEERERYELELDEAREAYEGWLNDSSVQDETQELETMAEKVTGWRYGNTLIHEDSWVEYVEELLVDCGYISNNLPGFIEIDWESTAENLAQDYGTVEYQGSTYYYRQ